jgi:hypothetical protein
MAAAECGKQAQRYRASGETHPCFCRPECFGKMAQKTRRRNCALRHSGGLGSPTGSPSVIYMATRDTRPQIIAFLSSCSEIERADNRAIRTKYPGMLNGCAEDAWNEAKCRKLLAFAFILGWWVRSCFELTSAQLARQEPAEHRPPCNVDCGA